MYKVLGEPRSKKLGKSRESLREEKTFELVFEVKVGIHHQETGKGTVQKNEYLKGDATFERLWVI